MKYPRQRRASAAPPAVTHSYCRYMDAAGKIPVLPSDPRYETAPFQIRFIRGTDKDRGTGEAAKDARALQSAKARAVELAIKAREAQIAKERKERLKSANE